MRNDLQNKMAEPAPDTCPHCGLPLSDFGCRPVRDGFYCQAKGLLIDPERMVTSVPADPFREQIEADERVKHARTKYEQAQREADELTSQWEEAALAAFTARQQRSVGLSVRSVGGQMYDTAAPGAPTERAIHDLGERQATADAYRRDAAEKAIAARIELDGARQWARAQLEALEQVQQIRTSLPA
jgi:hypothetical protein